MHSAVLSVVVDQEFLKKKRRTAYYIPITGLLIQEKNYYCALSLMKSKVEDPDRQMLQIASGGLSFFFF